MVNHQPKEYSLKFIAKITWFVVEIITEAINLIKFIDW